VPPITVLDNEFISMWYYPETKILHHRMHRFFSGQPFREAMNKGVEVFKQYGAHKWLSDDRQVPALSKEDLEWGHTDWYPRVLESGWKFWAIVMPEKVVGQMTLKKLVEDYGKQGLTARLFTSEEEAKLWLEECP
jgi:hypothetical protein